MKSLASSSGASQGYIRLPNGRAVSGFAHEYKRHGRRRCSRPWKSPLDWLRPATQTATTREFLDFMNGIIDAYGKEKEIHVILDNLNTHKPKHDRWLKSHSNVHLTLRQPALSCSIRLNVVELLMRSARRRSFVDVKQLCEAIDHFICAYNEQAAPFEWRQTESNNSLCAIISLTLASNY